MLSTRDIGQDAQAEITKDMLLDILSKFEDWVDQDGILTLALRGNGLLLLNPNTGKSETVGVGRMSPAMNHLR